MHGYGEGLWVSDNKLWVLPCKGPGIRDHTGLPIAHHAWLSNINIHEVTV